MEVLAASLQVAGAVLTLAGAWAVIRTVVRRVLGGAADTRRGVGQWWSRRLDGLQLRWARRWAEPGTVFPSAATGAAVAQNAQGVAQQQWSLDQIRAVIRTGSWGVFGGLLLTLAGLVLDLFTTVWG